MGLYSPSQSFLAHAHRPGQSRVPQSFLEPQPNTPGSPRARTLGYFAFPPNASGPSSSPRYNDPSAAMHQAEQGQRIVEEQERERQSAQDMAWTARLERDMRVRQERLAREEKEATRGQEEWVRSGGILRDVQGRRDVVRTEAVREELKLREVERVLTERWEKYEKRWMELLVSGKGKVKDTLDDERRDVRFCDIPWPVDVGGREVELGDLTTERVEEFLLEGLKVRGNVITRKERIRSSLLRWHPDKMTGLLARVKEDIQAVKLGISAVIISLQQLNSKVQ